jgi:uncharacterized membrane protein
MTGTVAMVALSVVLFVASHLVLSYPPLRARLVAGIGETAFRAVYSVLALALLVWVAMAYRDAPIVAVWSPPIGLMHLSLAIMPFACVFVVAGISTPNPTAIGGERAEVLAAGPRGILKVTRHPVMWGFALWGIAHLLANGDASSIVLFGGITLLALVGARGQDAKKRQHLGTAWQTFAAQTSFVPFAAARRTRPSLGEIGWWRIALGLALYALLLWLHPWLFGVSPLPL